MADDVQSRIGPAEADPHWLGVDPGSVRCGLALSDPSGTLASPLGVVHTEPRVTLVDRVSAVLAGRQLSAVVVGLPLQLRGKEGPAARLAREIGALLAEGLGCPAVYLDERFTTKEMLARRREAGITGDKARRDLDAWAAATILQSFLDRRHREGER